MKYIKRNLTEKIKKYLTNIPIVALLGSRQSGKSTLVKQIVKQYKKSIYLDLEKPSDLEKLKDPELFFEMYKDSLICLDEIQLLPDIFPVLRSVVDQNDRNGQFLLLGSASRDLVNKSSESLAGRIYYLELSPFTLTEIANSKKDKSLELLTKGGYPRSYLSKDDSDSFVWRENFIRSYLEKDLPMLGFNLPVKKLERFWKMIAHSHGQLFNSSKIGESMGINYHTVRNYLDILEQTFIARILYPFEANIKKRLVKSPKVYIRDSGILHALLNIHSLDELLSNPIFGSAWEGFAIENIINSFPNWEYFFHRTSHGSEIDLIMRNGQNLIAVEFKASTSPKLTKGFWNALDDLGIDDAWVIAPVKDMYPIEERVKVSNLLNFINYVKEK
ncbi:MAG: ATP-binding protein [Candidatus Delongbacteria bacterium]|jgi:predicted AAA+ superfamily ATPase|nr:ATP-binding protein [Candidatus Delongbacteria bacterium]